MSNYSVLTNIYFEALSLKEDAFFAYDEELYDTCSKIVKLIDEEYDFNDYTLRFERRK